MDRFTTRLLVDMGALLATIGISYLSFNYFENRFIGLKDKIAPKKHVPRTPVPDDTGAVAIVPASIKGPAH